MMINLESTKNLQPGDKISFFLGKNLCDGVIVERNDMDRGDIDFVIELMDGRRYRSKHKNLQVYCLYA